jgi:hypothetical protein
VPQEGCLGIQTHLQWLKDTGILIECQSPWNTPLLPIKKAGGDDYWPVQDLLAINNTIITLHPVVPNSYTLLSLTPWQASWLTCLDLKDAFFSLCLAPVTQPLFAFDCEDPPQWEKNTNDLDQIALGIQKLPTLFGKALAVDLSTFPEENPSCTLLQYVDDLLLASHNCEKCWKWAKALVA